MHTLRSAWAEANDDIQNEQLEHQLLGRLLTQTDEKEEIQFIKDYLNLEEIDFSLRIKPVFRKGPREVSLASITDHQFLAIQALKLEKTLASQLRSKSRAVVPDNLLLLTPEFRFSLIDLPQSYTDFKLKYLEAECMYCKKVNNDKLICLLCGKAMCAYMQDNCCKNNPG